MGASPKTLCATGRTDDLQAIVHIINSAKKYIYIAINEYIPMDLWKKKQPWTVIDDQIREGETKLALKIFISQNVLPFFLAVTKRRVNVKFLLNSRASHMDLMLKHMEDLLNVDPRLIEIKIYTVRFHHKHCSTLNKSPLMSNVHNRPTSKVFKAVITSY